MEFINSEDDLQIMTFFRAFLLMIYWLENANFPFPIVKFFLVD